MENASKAIIIAGGILVGVIILSLLVMVFSSASDVFKQQSESLTVEQLEKYNRQFNTFDKSLYGSELLSLMHLAEDYNNRVLFDTDINYRRENELAVVVRLYNYTASPLTDRNGDVIGKQFLNRNWNNVDYVLVETEEVKATANRGKLREYIELLENNLNSENEMTLKDFKNMPFLCVSNEQVKRKYIEKGYDFLNGISSYNEYNTSGRIKKMYFVQVVEEDDKFNL